MNLLAYQPGDSFLHRLNPLTKLAAAFLYGAACMLSGNVFTVAALILLMLAVAASAGLGGRAVRLTRSLFIVGLFMFVIQLFFVRTGDPLLTVSGVTLVTAGGLLSALLLSLRVIAAMLPLMLLFAITEVSDLCGALVKRLHVPYRYAFIVTTAFRFVPLFTSEFHDIEDAQRARGVEYDTRNIVKKMQLVAPLFVPLITSSLRKVDAGAVSAEMRGFNLRTYKSGYQQYPFHPADIAAVAVVVGLIVVAAVL